MRLRVSWPFESVGGERGWPSGHCSCNPYNPYIHGSRLITDFK